MHLRNDKIIEILERTLNHVDSRLIDHGKRVAYLMFNVLAPKKKYSDKQLRDICILGMLHDVGAYKTEEIDRMVIFETINVWEHSVYGYLFLKYFSPLKNFAPVIYYHHEKCDEITHLSTEHQLLAQLISLCDRADVFLQHGGKAVDFKNHVEKYRDIKYRSDVIEMFSESGVDIDRVFDHINSDTEFNKVFYGTPLTDDEAISYIKMVIFSIDFRSSQTVIHTAGATCISGLLAGLLGMNMNAIKRVRTGAMLHDIGKVGIPIHILESTEKLNDSDMEIMKTHVSITEKILEGSVDNDIKDIAARHHEKLDGSGYPRQLKADDIALPERIVAIADIFMALCQRRTYKEAFPKEKVIDILKGMTDRLDPQIISLVIEHFDEILDAMNRETQPVIQSYNAIKDEYQQVMIGMVKSQEN